MVDDLDVLMWEQDHGMSSQHLAWRAWRRFCVNRQSRWNGFLWRVAFRLDPPKGEPTERNGGDDVNREGGE